jgi:hypothetical protein
MQGKMTFILSSIDAEITMLMKSRALEKEENRKPGKEHATRQMRANSV